MSHFFKLTIVNPIPHNAVPYLVLYKNSNSQTLYVLYLLILFFLFKFILYQLKLTPVEKNTCQKLQK